MVTGQKEKGKREVRVEDTDNVQTNEEAITELDLLKKARQLVQRGWCQGPLAKTSNGTYCRPWDADATSFCLVGATIRAARDLGLCGLLGTVVVMPDDPALYVEARERLERVIRLAYRMETVAFNEAQGRTQEEVLRVLDLAAGGK